jgi:hypothetical protein
MSRWQGLWKNSHRKLPTSHSIVFVSHLPVYGFFGVMKSMPSDYICKSCKYTMSLGWYHYHGLKDGYGARTMFACAACGVTHYVEHAAPGDITRDRYLYQRERSSVSDEGSTARQPGPPRVSNDLFEGFSAFVCPVCESVGTVILEQNIDDSLPRCCLCEQEMDLLTKWVS